jgi:DNA-binding IclR family transcriptional regulator
MERALLALKELGRRANPTGLNELSRELGIPKASLHRALTTFRQAGFVAQDANGGYHLGSEFVRIAFEYHERRDEVALIDPLLHKLAASFGETTHFAKPDLPDVVYLGKVEPLGVRVRITSSVGGRNPAHATGVGKAALAHLLPDRAAVDDYIDRHGPLVARTTTTLTDAAALHDELEATRERGYALDRGELDDGVVCLAFPLFLASSSSPSGAVSVAALTHRTTLDRLVERADDICFLVNEHFGTTDVTRPSPSTT